MLHEMKLQNGPFNSIKNGKKTIELRLYDEKRQKVKIKDKIEFTNILNNEKILTEVINLHKYKTFDKESLGYNKDDIANPKDMEKYYSIEEQNKYGVLGIEIKIK